jgi:hypothetical protein
MNYSEQNNIWKRLPDNINEIQKQSFIKIYELASPSDVNWDDITFEYNGDNDLVLQKHTPERSKYIMIGEIEDDITFFTVSSGKYDSLSYNPAHNNLNALINGFFDDTI